MSPEEAAALGRVTAYLQGDWPVKVRKGVYRGAMLNDRLMEAVGTFITEKGDRR